MTSDNTGEDARPAGIGRALATGMLGGAIATTAMSAFMYGAQNLGLLGEMPPKKITRAAARAVGIFGTSRFAEDAAAVVAHWGFGMVMGAAYGFLYRRKHGVLRAALSGAAFGSAVWAGSYAGWVPALRIMSLPHRDRTFRPTSMAIAHLLYGGTLGTFVNRSNPSS
jgi:hypothetical protein